ncbi:IucA/IucC family protein [Vibrio algarum]|uniref:IucA/IucC family protein n=1 Tax=Vibrio algarum TaxID=3020714 RepID=A0ABT4YUM4_9VIBR|nr:IucA/IucC family protein [Vibrio sp. KJ40-1]MDB1125055.1 IucA/IucC family protein [Vibrio sp. KJ40-1]
MLIPHLYYLERYRNKGTRTYSTHASFTEASDCYRPDSDREQFELPVLTLPKEKVNIYLANPPQALANKFVGSSEVNFCVHPQVLETLGEETSPLRAEELPQQNGKTSVVPSSSTRTLFVLDDEIPHAVKVHFPFKVSRYTRKMRDEVIEQAINVSLELENGIDRMEDDFAYLREVIGISYKQEQTLDQRAENWGYVVRDMQPFPCVAEDRKLIPGFALYGEDFYEPDTPPILYGLLANQNPLDFVLHNIMLPIVRHWVDCFRYFGYIIEPHGQNVLIELDKSNTITRIVHRDLSVGIDMRRRRDIGLSSDKLNQYNRMDNSAFHSIAYDRFMGNHFFTRLVECCIAKFPHLAKEDFTIPCQREFARRLPEYRDYFPKNIWYFSEERDPFNKPLYEDTGAAPEWRPCD